MFPSLILTESILLSFDQETLIKPSEKFMGNVRQTKWKRAVLIYNNDSVGIASFLTDMYFSIIE